MHVHGEIYCDLCQIRIAPREPHRVNTGGEDFHAGCWARLQRSLSAQHNLGISMEAHRASERCVFDPRLLGG